MWPTFYKFTAIANWLLVSHETTKSLIFFYLYWQCQCITLVCVPINVKVSHILDSGTPVKRHLVARWDLSRQKGATKQGPLGCSYFRQWTPLPLELTTTIIYILDFYSQPLKRVTGCLCLLALRAQRKVLVNLKGEGRFHIGCSRSEPRDHCPGTTRLGPGGRRFKASSGCRETSLQASKQR